MAEAQQTKELPAEVTVQQGLTGNQIVGLFGSPAAAARTASTDIEIERAVAEAKIAMLVARQLPRNEEVALQKMLAACQRPDFAEDAIYNLPKKGSGGTIRLATTAARCWGNLKAGYIEHSHSDGQSVIEAFSWDLETNLTLIQRVVVDHIHYSQDSGTKEIKDPQSVRQVVASQAMRNLRNVIKDQIPVDMWEFCLDTCRETVRKQADSAEKLKKSLDHSFYQFKTKFNVELVQIESLVGKRRDKMDMEDYANLAQIFTALKQGIATVEETFESLEAIKKGIIDSPGTKPIAARAGMSGNVSTNVRPQATSTTTGQGLPPAATNPAENQGQTTAAGQTSDARVDASGSSEATAQAGDTRAQESQETSPAQSQSDDVGRLLTEAEVQALIAKGKTHGWTEVQIKVFKQKPPKKLTLGEAMDLEIHMEKNPKAGG